MSFIKWPTFGWWKHWFLIAEIEVSESPSKIEPCRLSSWRKWTTLRAATVSNANIDDGQGIISDKAAMTVPEEFQTTTPMPDAPKSSKIAPSKFVFKVPGSGGFQMIFFRKLLAGRFASSLLEFREVLLSLVCNLLQRHYCFLNSYLVLTIPNKPTVGDKEFSSFLVLQRQPEKIKERKKNWFVALCNSSKLVPQTTRIFS